MRQGRRILPRPVRGSSHPPRGSFVRLRLPAVLQPQDRQRQVPAQQIAHRRVEIPRPDEELAVEQLRPGHAARRLRVLPGEAIRQLVARQATGVHQAVTIWEQLTGKAGDAQIKINPDKPYGLSVNMGGDDKTIVAIVYK